MVSLASFLLDAEMSMGVVVAGQLDLAQSPFDGGGRRRCVQIWELEELGRGPCRWTFAIGFILSSVTGVNFDSAQSLCAMGPLQLKVVLVFFCGGSGRRRGGRPPVVHGDSRGFDVVFFFFFRDLRVVWLRQLFLHLRTCPYSYVHMYVFLT
jgi:hypothetical protein